MKIVNRHHLKGALPPGHVYIGRGSPLGNPFPITDEMPRESSIEAYDHWLDQQIASGRPSVLTALRGLNEESALVCSCAPLPCHGEVIARQWASWWPSRPRHRASMTYAGIGSRETPPDILRKMQAAAHRLEARGYTLRSGGADGADSAFEAGCFQSEIYLPWQGFRGKQSRFHGVCEEATAIARHLHPAFDHLKNQAAQKLMARNSYQILGHDLRTPCDFVLCWTKGGEEHEHQRTRATGGTGQAIALASRWEIPVFNMANPDALERLRAYLLQPAAPSSS